MTTPLLRLMAEDAADLGVVAASAQDALVKVGEMRFDKRARRFMVQMNRFRWESAGERGPYERIRAALSFEGVLAVKSKRVRQDIDEALASLLAVTFSPDAEPPGGVVRLVLAGGGEIALTVECLDVLLLDTGPSWKTPRRPDHERGT